MIPVVKTVVIIPAGGAGRRLQNGTSKQYLLLNGVPILVWTLRRFQESETVAAILLVVPPGDEDTVSADIVKRHKLSKVTRIIPGGKERQDSVRNGVAALDPDVDIVIVHDAVRPFISGAMIRDAVQEAIREGAAILAVPTKDTVKLCNGEQRVVCTPMRGEVWLAQTPQAFQRRVLVSAYEAAYRDGFYGTDDAGLVERLGLSVRVIPGSYDNLKITTPEDLLLAECLVAKERELP